MTKIKIVHVDDQVSQLTKVKDLLKALDEVELVNQFNSAIKARDFILSHQVDIAILDIEMPVKDGLWLAEQIKDSRTLIVFLTSHPDYALKAFEACAINYLLKPVTVGALQEVIDRYKKLQQPYSHHDEMQSEKVFELLGNYLNKNSYPKRLFVHNVHKTTVLNLEEVLYMISGGPYTIFKCKDGSKHTASKPLKVYYDALKEHPDFARIHRAHVVNKNHVKAVLRNKHKIIALMSDDAQLEITPLKRDEIYEMLGK